MTKSERPLHVLLVESDAAYTEQIREAFLSQGAGIRVTTARTVEEAKSKLGEGNPDLAVIDLTMAGGDVLELVPAGSDGSPCPFLYTTTNDADANVRAQAMRAGALDVINKSDITSTAWRRIAETALRECKHRRERHSVEELLEQSVDLLTFFNLTYDMVCVASTDGFFARVNPAFERVLGWSKEELLSKPFVDFVHPDDVAKTGREVESLAKGRPTVSFENRYRCADGTYKHLQWTAQSDPASGHIYAVARDISERKRAEEALTQSEERFRTLVENAPEAIVVLDTDTGCFIDANDNAVKLFGLEREELFKVGLLETSPPTQPDGRPSSEVAIEVIDRALAGGAPVTEWVHRNSLGEDIPCELRLVLLPGSDKQLIRGSITDITERKRVEEALRASERRTQLLKEVAVAANAASDPDDALQVALDCICDYTGWPVGHVYVPADDGTNDFKPTKLWHLESDERFSVFRDVTERTRFAPGIGLPGRVLSDHAPAWIVDVIDDPNFPRAKLADELGVHGAFGFPVMVGDEIAAILEFFSAEAEQPDETLLDLMAQMGVQIGTVIDRKRAEMALHDERRLLARRVEERTADLSAVNAELAKAARAKDEFMANMSHELRTPLNAILTITESLEEGVYGELDGSQLGRLETISASGRHLLSLINDILDLSKIEAGKLDFDVSPVDLEGVVQSSLVFVAEPARKKGIEVSSSIDERVTELQTDQRRLKQILVNMLSNAVKFTPEGGKVGLDVTGDVERGVVNFEVWDTGIGIAEEQMDRLFIPFAQVDARLSRKYEGTGLGLALVSRMSELLGGGVTLRSEGPGKGSSFTVTLPWSKADVSAELRVSGQRISKPVELVSRALVVEDSATAADQLQRYLGELGADTMVLTTGKDVVDTAAREKPDVILLDLILPDASGWDILAELKADERAQDIPVIVVSAVEERARSLAAGAAEHIVKPFNRDQLRMGLEAIGVVQESKKTPMVSPKPEFETASPLILLAEDNEANIQSISDYLRANGFHVNVARNGVEAIERTQEDTPSLILMDIQMPGMDGLEATRKIREDPETADTPIIALTALAMPGDRKRCLAAGANEYMSKPVSLKALKTTMDMLLNSDADQRMNPPTASS